MAKHICSKCKGEWEAEEGYLKHKCGATGYKPTQAAHLGEDFKKISEAALKRGEAWKEEHKEE